MADKITIKLAGRPQRERACAIISNAPAGYTVTIAEETRSNEQNRLMWPLIKDLREQNAAMGQFTPEQVKLRFLDALGDETEYLPKVWGAGFFAVGQRSSTLTKGQFSLLLELMFKWGAENGIKWSAKSEQSRAEVMA